MRHLAMGPRFRGDDGYVFGTAPAFYPAGRMMVPTPNKKMPVFVLLALALAMAAATPRPQLDLRFVKGKGSHAMLSLGFASIKLAFDSGHKCSNSNGCAGAML